MARREVLDQQRKERSIAATVLPTHIPTNAEASSHLVRSEHICYLVAHDFGKHMDPNVAKLPACDS